MKLFPALCAGLSLSLAACTVGPDFVAPPAPDVQAWKEPAASGSSMSQRSDPDPDWWTRFDDPILSELIQAAIAGNVDIQQAVVRVVEARQGVAIARSAGLPTLGGNAAYSRVQLGAKGLLQSQGAYKNLNALADKLQPVDVTSSGTSRGASQGADQFLDDLSDPQNLYQYGLDSSWELDLFGRVRRSVEQASARTQAQAEALNDALVLLESEIAETYAQLRGAQALRESQEQNIRAASDSLELTERRQHDGLTTQLDVDQARTQLDDLQHQLPLYDKQVQQAMNALSVLTGQDPGALDTLLRPVQALPKIPAVVGVGVPSSLARRRPDIREAEAQLHAATAGIGVAVASFYPDISLTGDLGIRALDASYLTKWASLFYSIGPSISVPIFQGGRLSANLRLAEAQAVEAALHFRGTVLNALREVEDALVAYRTDKAARDYLDDSVKAADLTLYLARDQYSHGLTGFIQVLDAERTAVELHQQRVQADTQLVIDVVALYRALGGGWINVAGSAPAPPLPIAQPITPAALDSLAQPASEGRVSDGKSH